MAEAFKPGDHGTTYGGNPFATAAVSSVFDIFEELRILDNVNTVAPYLSEKLQNMTDKYGFIKEHRGLGLMRGLEFAFPVKDIIEKAMDKGLILISAGADIIRFVPPLIITKQHVDDMVEILDSVLDEIK